MDTDAIDYSNAQAIIHSERPRQTESSTIYHIPQQSIQHTQPSHNIDEKPHDENIYYVCTLCETPTKFTNYHRLEKHVKRFHSDFDQNVKGSKRKRVKEEKVFPKKAKWNWT